MKILLVQPPSNKMSRIFDDFILHEPLGLEYVAAGVRQHHDIKILDLRLDNNYRKVLEEFNPDVVGITSFTVQMKSAKKVLKETKEFNDKILTVIGGHHATASPADFNEKYINVVAIGEGVFTFKEIVEHFDRKKDLTLENFRKIEGIAVRHNGLLFFTPPRSFPNIDNLPLPDRSLTLPNREKYFNTWMKPLAMMRTSVGCRFRCNFCLQWKMSGGKYLARDPNLVVGELASLKEPYVSFADDETLLDTKRMANLADMIRKAGIKKKYRFFARADTIVKHPDLIKRWKEIGLTSLLIGFESYKDDDLKFLNKKTSTAINEKAIKILQDNKIEIIADFIIKQDYDEHNFKELKAYVRRLGLTNPKFPILTPFPGTQLYDSVQSQIFIHDYDFYDLRHTVLPTKLPLEKFYDEVMRLKNKTVPVWQKIINLRNRPTDEWKAVLSWSLKISLHKYNRKNR